VIFQVDNQLHQLISQVFASLFLKIGIYPNLDEEIIYLCVTNYYEIDEKTFNKLGNYDVTSVAIFYVM